MISSSRIISQLEHFGQTYDLKVAEKEEGAARIARRKLSAKLRPLLLRRSKAGGEGPAGSIEQRLDCELPEEQRMLYLPSKAQPRTGDKAVKQKGIAKSKMHVLRSPACGRFVVTPVWLAAIRVPQDGHAGVGRTAVEWATVLIFSQFVRMLQPRSSARIARFRPSC